MSQPDDRSGILQWNVVACEPAQLLQGYCLFVEFGRIELDMLPARRQWARWAPLQKATYVAQLAAPFTLLATVVFSFLSWREAIDANIQQQRFFVSQNSPEVQMLTPRIVQSGGQPWVFFTFKNVGGSGLRSPCVTIHQGLSVAGKKAQTSSCEGENPYKGETIDRDRTFMFYVPQAMLGLRPEQFIIWHAGDAEPKCSSPRYALLLMDVNYYDIAGDRRGAPYELLVCGK